MQKSTKSSRRYRTPEPQSMSNDFKQNGGQFLGIGLYMAVGVGLGVLVGLWLDKKYGWSPWGVTVGSMVGLASGMYLLIKEALRINKD